MLPLAQLVQLVDQDSISVFKLFGKTLINGLLLLKNANDEAYFFPQGDALGETLVEVLAHDAKLVVDAATRADIQTASRQH